MKAIIVCWLGLTVAMCLWMEMVLRQHEKQMKKRVDEPKGFFVNEYFDCGPGDLEQ
mgnify:FL=1